MGKANRAPVQAAGGIVVRHGPKPLVAIVQRRRDDAWVLPKGKLKPNEKPIAAAKREAMEETGADVRVHDFLGVISYLGSSGPKIVHFWRMRALNGRDRKPMADIKAVAWLPLSTAIEQLALPHEKSFLRNVGRKALRGPIKRTRGRALGEAIAVIDPKVAALADEVFPAVPSNVRPLRGTASKSSRWHVLSQLTRRWQSAIGRTRRTG